MLGLIIGIGIGCLLFIPSLAQSFGIELPAWTKALAGLGFPLFFIISSIKQKKKNKSENPTQKITKTEKESFKNIESGPGRGPNIKY
ncbi:MAG: hypothetical protein ACJAT2_002117 [Bacteriovoracaceae bacterium]|jgi:hypothetical protein